MKKEVVRKSEINTRRQRGNKEGIKIGDGLMMRGEKNT